MEVNVVHDIKQPLWCKALMIAIYTNAAISHVVLNHITFTNVHPVSIP